MDAREKIETVLGEIRSSLSEFRTIINTIPAIAWSSRPDGSVDFVNNRWEEYTGLSSEQSLRRRLAGCDPSRRPTGTAEELGGISRYRHRHL